MDKGASWHEDASSSQGREMQSRKYWKIRKLRAEVEEAEQARKDKLVREARDIEAEVKEAKDAGVGRSTGEAEEESSRRSISTRESGVE